MESGNFNCKGAELLMLVADELGVQYVLLDTITPEITKKGHITIPVQIFTLTDGFLFSIKFW